MRDVARQLRSVIDRCVGPLLALDSDTASRPAPGKWSKKEILGHLIDSAGNNQQKFVRLLTTPSCFDFVGYAQDAWVAAQHYQEADWSQLVATWEAINRHLAHVIEHADPASLSNTLTIAGAGPFRLDFVVRDYVEHTKHHLRAILPDAGLTSVFENVYGA